ncbi:hypothetical protein EZV62_004883 [Acer yangbiense]|uniref:SWIM-type domain-containing protein n=1 Tax=Acer yangbiense TaxID=1000413 RepID=A0A5C7ILA7_9ROSI|nr:hypothetical protein EZV62_004883 [Acer yangbiense]
MFDYVASSDEEGLGGDNRDGVSLDGDNRDDENNDYRDGVGLDGDYRDGDITKECMDLFEGYESRSDDEFSFDSNTDKSHVKVDKLLRGVPFQRDGQTFANKEVMRDIFKEYVVQEGVVLDRIKNDKQRQTYQCNASSCLWRAHASWIVDKSTFMIKSLVDQHECHRVCNNKEAKVKWIASKFDPIVKSNPSINVKVLGDLMLDKFNVSVDLKRLYSDKEFLEGCRPFIGIDGCHLKGPCGGILLSAVALDANSGLFPLDVCICEKETKYSWMWFLNNLKMYLHFKKLFWKASRCSNVYDFKAALNDIVKLRQYNCGCGSWQISGIPCPHAMVAISHNYSKNALRDMTRRCGQKLKLMRCFHHHFKSNVADQRCKGRENLVRRANEARQRLLSADTRTPSIAKALSSQPANDNSTRKKKTKVIYKFIVLGNYVLEIVSLIFRIFVDRNNIQHQEEVPIIHLNLNHSHSSLKPYNEESSLK